MRGDTQGEEVNAHPVVVQGEERAKLPCWITRQGSGNAVLLLHKARD